MSRRIYCPKCGAENDADRYFCDSCGVKFTEVLNVPASQVIVISHQYVPQTYLQTNPQTALYNQIPQSQSSKKLVILGLIMNIVTFLGLSGASWFVPFYIVIIFFVFAITGIIISGISTKQNQGIGILGLVLGILGIIPIILDLFILLIFT